MQNRAAVQIIVFTIFFLTLLLIALVDIFPVAEDIISHSLDGFNLCLTSSILGDLSAQVLQLTHLHYTLSVNTCVDHTTIYTNFHDLCRVYIDLRIKIMIWYNATWMIRLVRHVAPFLHWAPWSSTNLTSRNR